MGDNVVNTAEAQLFAPSFEAERHALRLINAGPETTFFLTFRKDFFDHNPGDPNDLRMARVDHPIADQSVLNVHPPVISDPPNPEPQGRWGAVTDGIDGFATAFFFSDTGAASSRRAVRINLSGDGSFGTYSDIFTSFTHFDVDAIQLTASRSVLIIGFGSAGKNSNQCYIVDHDGPDIVSINLATFQATTPIIYWAKRIDETRILVFTWDETGSDAGFAILTVSGPTSASMGPTTPAAWNSFFGGGYYIGNLYRNADGTYTVLYFLSWIDSTPPFQTHTVAFVARLTFAGNVVSLHEQNTQKDDFHLGNASTAVTVDPGDGAFLGGTFVRINHLALTADFQSGCGDFTDTAVRRIGEWEALTYMGQAIGRLRRSHGIICPPDGPDPEDPTLTVSRSDLDLGPWRTRVKTYEP